MGTISGPHSQIEALPRCHFTSHGFTWLAKGHVDIGVLCEFLSLYLKRRFYAKFAIKYLMASFYATVICAKGIMNSPLGDIHKGKILHQLVNRCLNKISVIM